MVGLLYFLAFVLITAGAILIFGNIIQFGVGLVSVLAGLMMFGFAVVTSIIKAKDEKVERDKEGVGIIEKGKKL